MKAKTFLFFIIALGFFLRVYNLTSYPTGFTQDEAGIGYDAYSILKTGRDSWGEYLPLSLRSFGDFKLPLYSYLAVPSIALFGLNEFAVRLPNAVIGTLAIYATYLLVKELRRGDSKLEIGPPTGGWNLEILAATLLAVSPWHLPLSRGAFEANLTTFFIPFGIYSFWKGLRNPKWLVVSALTFGLSLFSYHAARFFVPPMLALLIYVNAEALMKLVREKKYRTWVVISTVTLLLFIIPACFSTIGKASARPLDVTILNPTDKWQAVADRRYVAYLQGLPDLISRVFSNKAVYVFELFTTNYFTYISPFYLFIQGAGEWTYGMIPGQGVLYLFESVFVFAALIAFVRERGFKYMNFFLLWLILSPIPAALTKGPGYAANRAALMMPAIQVISAYGAFVLWIGLKNSIRPLTFKYVLIGIFSLLAIFNIAKFTENYIYHAPVQSAESMHYGIKETVKYVASIEYRYDNIVVSRTLSVPNIWIAFFEKWDPVDYQNESKSWLVYEQNGYKFLDQLDGYRLGKYIFGSINSSYRDKNVLVVGKPDEFKYNVPAIKTIYYPSGRPAYLIVEGKDL